MTLTVHDKYAQGSIIADGKGKIVKKELSRTEKRAFWAGANLALLGVIAVSVWSFVDFIREPEVRAKSAGLKAAVGDLEGVITGTTVRLTDPGVLDRIVAASPSLVTVIIALAVLIYSAWMDWQATSGPDRGGVMNAKIASAASVAMMIAPVICQIAASSYFRVQISFDWDGGTVLLLFLVMTHLFLRVHENRENWVQEYRRAATLDEQVKGVV